MSLVTDPETIRELEALRGQPQPSQGVISNPDLINELESLRNKRELSKPVPKEVTQEVQEQGSTLGNIGRTALSMGTAIAAESAAGLWGLMTFAGTGDFRRAVKEIEETREALTYTPGTVGGQQNLQAIATVLAPLAEGIETVSENSADLAFKYTGSPEAAGVAAAIPLVALELAGIKGVRSAGRGVKQISEADVRKAQKAMLTHPELKYNGSVAEVKLNNNGRLVEDKAGKALVKAGVRENDASVITNSTKQTKQGMKDMIRLFEEGKGNDVIAMANKTTNPIGRSITNRLQSLKTVRSGLGKRLQAVVDGDLGETKVDISSSIAPINTMLNEAGIKPILRGNKLVLPKDWHVGTTFGLKNMAGVRKTIEDAYALFDIQTTGGITDLKSAHGLKKNLDELVDASKLSEAGVTQQTIRKIAEMRKAVNDELSKVPQYGAVNDELGKVIQAMAPFEKFLEPGQKFTDAKVTDIVGNTMKTVSSDSVAAAALRQDLLAVEKYMRDANIAFPDDPAALIQFREALLNNFNISPATTVDYGTGSRLGSAAVSLSLGNTFGAGHDAAQLIRIGMKKRQANKLAKDNKKAFNIIKMSVNQ